MSELEHAAILLEMELFGKVPKTDLLGIGVGDSDIHVLLFDGRYSSRVPKNFMGFPVKVEVTGEIEAAGL